jgi:hypothetical protein
MVPKILWFTLFLQFVSLTTGCATVYPPEQGIVSDAPLDHDEGIVFGTLSSEAGVGTRYDINFGPVDTFDSERKSWLLQGDTQSEVFFAMRLPMGNYRVSGIHVGNGRAYVTARFTVASNKATYIGSLQVGFFSGAPGIFGGPTTRVGVRVTNQIEKAQQQYKQRNPRLPYEITTNLMKMGG